MTDYYVDYSAGNDSTGNGAVATPWKTIWKALTTISTAGGHTVYCTNGQTFVETGGGANFLALNKSYTNPVVVRPVTNPGPFQVGFTVHSNGGGYVVRQSAAMANLEFRNANFEAAGTDAYCFYFGGYDASNVTFTDCTFTLQTGGSATYCMRLVDSSKTFDNMKWIRCTWVQPNTGTKRVMLCAPTSTAVMSNWLFEDNISHSAAKGAYIYGGTITNITVRRGVWSSAATDDCTFLIGTQGSSQTCTGILVDGARVIGVKGGSHTLFVQAQGAEVRNCTLSDGDYSLVAKFGTGYNYHNNLIIRSGGLSGTGILLKGAANCTVANNTIINEKGYCVETLKNDDDSNNKCAGVVIKNNICLSTAATSFPLKCPTDSISGVVVVDNNVYQGDVTANGWQVLATTCHSLADAIGAWDGGGFTGNDSHSVLATAAVDSQYIPYRNGNCDVGRGNTTVRTIGAPDLYGRPKLRADADCIGAVYPQRDDERNVLQPVMQFAGEAV